MKRPVKHSSKAYLLSVLVVLAAMIGVAHAHGVEGHDQQFITSAAGFHPFPFAYLGAKHMVTGYDHLLYLAGVIFFLHRLRDVIRFVSLFALGHSITLLLGVLANIHINPFAVDTVIGLSVCYKALENLGILKSRLNINIDPQVAVFAFGLVHGFGLSSKLQDLELSPDGLIANMISFNVGVEIGQIVALVFLFLLFTLIRPMKNFEQVAIWVNIALFGAGVFLAGSHITGLLV